MKKRFNITGICYPERHYMMDSLQKLDEIVELIECYTRKSIWPASSQREEKSLSPLQVDEYLHLKDQRGIDLVQV